ncbi:hypothetical protein FC52_GL001377 [Lactobacillus pasteurii DSM 23907 = CRBIP 24.76]|uniref:SCP domain-containing protein n=1 Tax=Lactobacillus pasteurii DSM 23907 = CRBIP 24.76 TaxID=1423790 RepID=I7KKA3_9LACO|nr:CAP domain-containing protein [Lactobacillus pasteurii]KRK07938.1 hypothetical protein FC52_GL001377 [Lactobacillus pasteurii DSM 23907 = CRBIP 24.76]TDG77897.1 hypothetical protein C5L33_001702 [Lactobacillus pasteurii]CCI84294.1 Putative uncharacterized protein [Lactobacillus pasteurii DSM 23907 = CRBIP 24.76]
MKLKYCLIVASSLIFCALPNNQVQAAKYSPSEAKQVKQFQKDYVMLDRSMIYDQSNLYEIKPNFASPFNPGRLKDAYVKTSIAYVNYYRSLFGLKAENNFDADNLDAQLAASALASVNAEANFNAHGLTNYHRPKYFPKNEWSKAQTASLGNINFLDSPSGATAGEIVTDLLQDRNNISGTGDTGHRALILSSRATRIGIGASYGQNGRLYSVQNGIFADDILRKATKDVVTYPAKTLFAYELLDKTTPWSAYFAKKTISCKPSVYITDLTTGKKTKAKYVKNYGRSYYASGYISAITFSPSSKLKLVNTHKYRVQIGKSYSYSFRLFRQNNYQH